MKDRKEYWLFADESVPKGKHFSNFYGGVLMEHSQYEAARARLLKRKQELGLGSRELKWCKVSEKFENEYREMILSFFQEMKSQSVRMRVMFRESGESHRERGLEKHERYTKLYYQFIKHSFGLLQRPIEEGPYRLRILLDDLPDTKNQIKKFKNHLASLPSTLDFTEQDLVINPRHVTEIDSADYIVLQCLDIVLGAMAFRLNDQQKEKPPGQFRRGKKTVVKERLYKLIRSEIIKVNEVGAFDPKVSTGGMGEFVWSMPYRHWLFRGKNKRSRKPTSIPDA